MILFLLFLLQQMPPDISPGALNASVTQESIQQTICKRNWSKTVRPTARFTNSLKRKQMVALHLHGTMKQYEEDHRVPIELGGNPMDPANLWPQPWAKPGAHQKDKLENAVKRDVCAGTLTLQQGRDIFLGDFWKEFNNRRMK